MPYQVAWLADHGRFKIWEKSRRIGATYVQALEDVLDASNADNPMDVWFSSADESAALEYIEYCKHWAKIANIVAVDIDADSIVDDNDIKAYSIRFGTGKRITGLSSNPKAFRSKGGKIVWDEAAFHERANELWKAAQPAITWGFPIRVLSTHNGQGCRFYRMVEEAKKPESVWSLHTVSIQDAVEQGLADKIFLSTQTEDEQRKLIKQGFRLSHDARQKFIDDCRRAAGDQDTFAQEYGCVAVDETTAWLTYDLIRSCIDEGAGVPQDVGDGDCYVGWDVARHRDLSIIWVIEKVGDVAWTREVVMMHKQSYKAQLAEFARVMKVYNVRRACVDETGMGGPVVEEAQATHGGYSVEGVTFTNKVKQDLATVLRGAFEDRQVRIPNNEQIIEAHHAVKKIVTAAGNSRFDADRTDKGHADEFWAHALALHGMNRVPPAFGVTVNNDNEGKRGYGII